jgi:hypothetical protein
MRGEHDRRAFSLQSCDDFPELQTHFRIESRCWLIKKPLVGVSDHA